VKYGFIKARQDQFKVTRMCRALEVSRSGYYSWRDGKESQRSERNRSILVEIQTVHEENRQAYAAVKTWRELRAQGVECGRHRVARLKRQAGIEARRKRRFRITTQSRGGMIGAENKLKQRFELECGIGPGR
jgi:putative transposase